MTKSEKKEAKEEPAAELITLSKYTIATTGQQAERYDKMTKAIGEYVGKKYGHEMKILVLQKIETKPTEPQLEEKPNNQQEITWGKKYDLYLKKMYRYEDEKAKVLMIILGQCENPMKHKVECHK